MFKYLILVIFCAKAFASDFKTNPDFKRLEDFISQIKTAQGTFTHKFNNLNAQADFYLKIPSKLRINYTSKNMPINIVITPTIMTYYDTKLDQKSQVKTPKTAIALILTPQISLLDEKIKIIDFTTNNDNIIVHFTHSEMQDTNIKAIFNKNTLHINKLILIQDDQTETIYFTKLNFNKKIDNGKFSILNKKIDAKFDF